VPKLYEYFGLTIMFYSNEHKPIHVHGKSQGRESRAEIIILEGVITSINYTGTQGKAPLTSSEMVYFKEIVSAKSDEIVQKWVDYFVLHKSVSPEQIQRRLK
jgi:Domain of unknown function (DUF4160)